jgi:SAM-dependent methyltransferase
MAENKDSASDRQTWLSEYQYMEKYYVPNARHSALYQQILDKIVRLVRAHHPVPRHVADFGCGPGLVIERLLRVFPGIERVDGFDSAAGLGEIGLANFVRLREAFGKRLFFFEGPDGDLTKPLTLARQYDLVLNNNVLFIFNEEAERRQAVRNLAGALAPGGLLIVSTITPLFRAYLKSRGLLREEMVYHYLLKPWRFFTDLGAQMRQKKRLDQVNRSVESRVTPELLAGWLEENGLAIIGEDFFYTPHKYWTEGVRSAGGVMYAARRT